MGAPIGIGPDAGLMPCFMCGKQVDCARLCASCSEASRKLADRRESSRRYGAVNMLAPFGRAAQLPLPYRREL